MELSSFIGTAEWSEFVSCYRTRQFTSHPITSSPQRFRLLWSEWELAAMCRFSRLSQDEGFRLFTRGRMILRDAYLDKAGALREDVMQKLWASGVSITMRYLEDYSNRVLAVARGLEVALRCPVQVNLYVTPGEGQGLGAHFDDHDVLVLQIQGRKFWEIYSPAGGIAEPGATANRPAEAPVIVTLETGGWLYLPKGIRHEVRNKAAEPSIHFTISFHPMTWGRMVQDGLDKALQGDRSFDFACPAGASVAAGEIERYFSVIQTFVQPPENYYQGFKGLQTPVSPSALADRIRLDTASATTRFVWRTEEVDIGRDGCELDLGYRRRPLLLRPDLGAVVGWMAQKGAIRPAEFESLDLEAALLLCKFLASVGILRVED